MRGVYRVILGIEEQKLIETENFLMLELSIIATVFPKGAIYFRGRNI